MTTERSQPLPIREWLMFAVMVLGLGGDAASRYFGAESDSRVTASQVKSLGDKATELSGTLKTLSDKLDGMPRADQVSALSQRMDRAEQSINGLSIVADGLRHDLDPLLRAPAYRSPPR